MTAVIVTLGGRSQQDAILHGLQRHAQSTRARGRAVSVWLSGALARPFLFGPVQGLRGWSEVNSAAQSAARQACGIDEPCQVVLEGEPSMHRVLGTAVRVETVDAIHRTAASLGLRVKSIRPAWAEVIDSAPAARFNASLLVCSDEDAVTLLGQHEGRFDLASTYVPRPGVDEVEGLVRRMQLSRDLAPKAMLMASIHTGPDGQAKVAWSDPQATTS